ncbi:unnamed protein product [Knipowitschia caucasica]
MHRSYQPLKPVTNRYLQQKWDQADYDNHRKKVTPALPVVDTKGPRTPSHMQLKLKKQQLQEERLSIIDKDNRLLSSRLVSISCSRGLVDHLNHYHSKSLRAERSRAELQLLQDQNLHIYRRLSSQQSEYRRQLWLQDWNRTNRLRDDISRYPPLSRDKERSQWKVKFAAGNRHQSISSRDT